MLQWFDSSELLQPLILIVQTLTLIVQTLALIVLDLEFDNLVSNLERAGCSEVLVPLLDPQHHVQPFEIASQSELLKGRSKP